MGDDTDRGQLPRREHLWDLSKVGYSHNIKLSAFTLYGKAMKFSALNSIENHRTTNT
ncbi:MAG: hypothetical protein BTN85_0353 [Candidatus Methanohalarchaeum thermophilum]|uniref:Uncharacterized protein n=1 Tax=Methanohalarchaeum thermophilum TaxID=1903181 RepID=A0A1Q6DU53_METT1|nr:MAG: hypothetical protein BTN85_0353 [Candidatus Methanohalarchaeum thermophilum]